MCTIHDSVARTSGGDETRDVIIVKSIEALEIPREFS